jgi:dipeptidase D
MAKTGITKSTSPGLGVIMASVSDWSPPLLWKHFFELTQIPRESKKEQAAAAYVMQSARGRGLAVQQDRIGNVLVNKPATSGYENAAPVILQSHLDMVCEKKPDISFDFARQKIKPIKTGDWLSAEATTLGADNGIGVAAMLALLEETKIAHPPLECLFTVDEEVDMTGATELNRELCRGRLMINLDDEEEGCICIGSAGGFDTLLDIPVFFETNETGKGFRLEIQGLPGGHSGLDIDQHRGNALKVIAAILVGVSASIDIRLANIQGGSKFTAIPTFAQATCFVPENISSGRIEELVRDSWKGLKEAGQPWSETARLDLTWGGSAPKFFTKESHDITLASLLALPHGVIEAHQQLPVVATSTNLATVNFYVYGKYPKVQLKMHSRSLHEAGLRQVRQMISAIGLLGNIGVTHSGDYPCWQPRSDSPLVRTARRVYESLFQAAPRVRSVHAGSEAGIFAGHFPGIDIISIGPTILSPHAPGEKVHIGSVERFYTFLLGLLRALNMDHKG